MFSRPIRNRPHSATLALVAFLSVVFVADIATTHEGHAPLPTKGVEVDIKKGLLTLSPDAQKSLGLLTTPADMQILEQESLAYATLVTPWNQQNFVSTQVAGRITALHVNSGDSVEAGQVLAEIESPELENLRLELRNAANAVDLSQRQVDRLGGLARNQAIPGRELMEAVTALEQDKIALQVASSKLASLGLSETTIASLQAADADASSPLRLPLVSPIRGSVSHADLAVGKVVMANEHLFEINDISKLWVQIGVLETDLMRINVGQPVELEFTAIPGQTFQSTIAIVGNYVDPVTHVATVWAEVLNDPDSPDLLPGMYGTAKISTANQSKLLTIPAASLLGSGAERYVLVEVAATAKGHEFRKQNVVVVSENTVVAQVGEGSLFPGDRVVSRGGQVLSSFFVLGSLRLSPEGIRNVGLQIEPVSEQLVSRVVSIDGMIDLPPGRIANVTSQVPGTLRRVLVDRDEPVAIGDVIAEVTSLEFLTTQLEMLKADREYQLLKEMLEKISQTGSEGIVPTKRIWEMESSRADSLNRRKSHSQRLASMGLIAQEIDEIMQSGRPRETLPIRSPINGTVVKLNKVLGEQVGPDESVFEIHDLSHVLAKGFLSERDAGLVQTGASARVRLTADPSLVVNGKIVRSTRQLSELNRTLVVWVELETGGIPTLQRNLLARISTIFGEPQTAIAVPLTAIATDGTRNFVFVQKEDGLIERRNVETGQADDRFVVIQSGLNSGEMIAVQGTAELQTTYASVR